MTYNFTETPLWTSITQRMPTYLIPFSALSYRKDAPLNPDSFKDSSYYGTGPLDICLIVTIIAIMAVLRDAFRLGLFEPLAYSVLSRRLERRRQRRMEAKTNGSSKIIANGNPSPQKSPFSRKELGHMHRSVLRFAEQGWSCIYYAFQWSFGFYVNMKLPTQLLDASSLWAGYPHYPLPGTVKLYYLMQFAFYLHQILILNAEARRKDHVQMLMHHVITLVLMALSYHMNFTRVGCLLMVIMDWCDIFLPLAKMIRYLSISQFACDCIFGIFLVSWLFTRHGLFVLVIKAVYDTPNILEFVWDPEMGSYLCMTTWFCFYALLVSLQILQLIWFWMICRVAWRVVSGKGAVDERSDDESDTKTE